MTKKSIIVIGLLFVLAIGGTVAYAVQKEKEAEALRIYEAKIEQQVNDVTSELATIDDMSDENAKLEKLKELNKAYESYKKSEEKDERVSAAYESSISKLKDSFKASNEAAVAENTINDLEKASIDDLKKHIEKLTGLNDKVELQGLSVYTKAEQETISSKIVALNKEYADKVTELEKKVAEEKKKKEEATKLAAEKKKKEEEAAAAAEAQQYQAQQQGSGDQASNGYATQNDAYSNNNGDYSYSAPAQNSNNNYSSGSGSSNAASPSNGGGSYQEPQQQVPAQGNIIEKGYGTSEDADGNKVDNWVGHDGNGNFTAGIGNGSNDQALDGGWSVK